MELKTPRLIIDEIAEDDFDPLVAAHHSNPDHLARTEGTAGVVGLYDRSKLGRDLAVAALDPARETLAVRTRAGARPIGMVDLLRKHPDNARPWLGVVVIHADQQRRGYGGAVVEAVASWAGEELEATEIGAEVDEDDERGRAFLRAVGFDEVGRRWRRGPAGEVVVIIQELSVHPHHEE